MGEPTHDGLAIPGRVVLAHEPSFTLGELRVHAATRQVERDGRCETLEPRVMQVLVALAKADGTIVTREELIDRCWEGRIVSDDAINRVLSRIRQVAAGIGNGSFTLQTIAKVGYRLRAGTGVGSSDSRPAMTPAAAAQSKVSRRGLLAVAGGAALGVAGVAALWLQPWRHRPVPEAEQLYRRGALLAREGMPGSVRQSVSYFERAVAIDPDYAAAWGALALGYSHLLRGFDEAELASLPPRIRSAANRAFELDPGNGDAQLALVYLTPHFRNWAEKETALKRVIADHPRHWLAHARLAALMYEVGRLGEGIERHRKALAIEPMLPISHFFLIRNLSALGRMQEAEATIEAARRRWPSHPALWFATFEHLLYSGRPKSAAAFAMNPDTRPSEFNDGLIAQQLRLARAIETRAPADVDASIADLTQLALQDVSSIADVAPAFAALGRADLAFASLDRYLLNRGTFGNPVPIRPTDFRKTDALFTAPMADLRRDPQFATLVRDVGLEAYWRRSGTLPDYRRA